MVRYRNEYKQVIRQAKIYLLTKNFKNGKERYPAGMILFRTVNGTP